MFLNRINISGQIQTKKIANVLYYLIQHRRTDFCYRLAYSSSTHQTNMNTELGTTYYTHVT